MHSVKYCVLFCVYFVADCNTLWSFDGLVSVDLADMLLYRKLLQFGVLEGLVRRVQKYPVQLVTSEASFSRVSQQQLPQKQLSKYLDGSQCFDEISCHTGSCVCIAGRSADICISFSSSCGQFTGSWAVTVF